MGGAARGAAALRSMRFRFLIPKPSLALALILSFGQHSDVDARQVQIRRLEPSEGVAYREIRLEALRLNPEGFGSTFEAESVRPLAHFSERVASCPVFGAFRDAELVGMAGFWRREGIKDAHKAMLWGMYVRSNARNRGVGRRLAEAVIGFAREHVEVLQLSVVSENEAARQLYASLGFVEYGIERKALKQGGRYYDEILMAKHLSVAATDLKADAE
jgi:RimJ/RimL family protein N-acetyltransferase